MINNVFSSVCSFKFAVKKFFVCRVHYLTLDWQKNNFARASRFFVHFLAVVAQLRHETS